jgi:hypothetical protein
LEIPQKIQQIIFFNDYSCNDAVSFTIFSAVAVWKILNEASDAISVDFVNHKLGQRSADDAFNNDD